MPFAHDRSKLRSSMPRGSASSQLVTARKPSELLRNGATMLTQSVTDLAGWFRGEALRSIQLGVAAASTDDLQSEAWELVRVPGTGAERLAFAVRLAREAVDVGPGDAFGLEVLGAAHFRAGEFDAAIEVLSRARESALREHPDEPRVSLIAFLAMALRELGRTDEANAEYASVVALKQGGAGAGNGDVQMILREVEEYFARNR